MGQRVLTYPCNFDSEGNGNCANTPSTNVYFGKRLLTQNGNPVALDRLGSVRYNASAQRLSYYPYGQERPQTNGQTTPDGTDKFATYFRDGVGQDYADQRYYNQAGTFFSPDRTGMRSANPNNPASWNRYAYAGGDPANFADPTGTEICSPGGDVQQDACSALATGDGSFGTGATTTGNNDPCQQLPEEDFFASPSPCLLYSGPEPTSAPSAAPTCSNWGCMPAAFSRAIQALTLNSDCMSLFGTEATRQNGFNPANVLIDITYGSHNFGTVSFSSHSAKWGVAQTRPAGLVPIPGLAGKVKISINELPGYGFWNNGDATENAETLLHELGHVFNDLKGAGGFALPNSAENNDPYAFDKLVKQKCFN